MQNNFEGLVQKKLDDLRLTPSAPVWEKIEWQIRPEKKRRRFLPWLLFGLLVSGTGGWLLRPVKPKQNSFVVLPAKQKSPFAKQPTATDTVLSGGKQTVKQTANNAIASVEKSDVHSSSASPIHTKKQPLTTEAAEQKSVLHRQLSTNDLLREQENKTRPGASAMTDDSAQHSAQPISKTAMSNLPKALPDKSESLSTTYSTSDSAGLRTAADSVRIKKKVAVQPSWKKKFLFFIGRNAEPSSAGSLSNRNTAALSLPGSFQSTQSAVPSRPGLALAIGLSFIKKWSKNFQAEGGLQLALYTTRQPVGNAKKLDSAGGTGTQDKSAEYGYTNTAQNSYTNKLFFIALPVSISYTPSAGLPLSVSAGAAYGVLLSSNQLTFNEAKNIYVVDKGNNTKQLVQLSASVQYRFKTAKGLEVQTGPAVLYNVTKSQVHNTVSSGHANSLGLKTSLIF